MSESAPHEPTPQSPSNGAVDDELAGFDDRARRYIERARSEAAAFRHERSEAREELERLRREHESDHERIVREAEERGRARAEAEHAQALQGYERQLARMEIKTKAAGRFADAEDAVRMLDLDALLSEKDARKREKAVDAALAELLESKPYLARGEKPGPLVTQGGRSQQPDGRPRERSWLRG